jgi:hypothetical protein
MIPQTIYGSSRNRVGENVGLRGRKPALGAAGAVFEGVQKSGMIRACQPRDERAGFGMRIALQDSLSVRQCGRSSATTGVRVLSLTRRSKTRPAGRGVGCNAAGTTARSDGSATRAVKACASTSNPKSSAVACRCCPNQPEIAHTIP